MKKLFIMMAALVGMSAAMTSCDEIDTDTRASYPTDSNFLNTPPTANYTYDLANTQTVTLTCSQPDYGVGTIPTYAVELSLDKDFKAVPSQWRYTGSDATPQNFILLPSTTNSTTIEIPARDIADAINACRGYNDLDQLDLPDYRNYTGPIYLRVRSYMAGATPDVADLYAITSNIISLTKVIGFKTLRQPDFIYLVGAPEGWAGPTPSNADHYELWKLFEADDNIGSQIYSATFDIPAGKFQFRFYSRLEDWDNNSIGSQNDDNPVNIELKDGVYTGACVVGTAKGEGKGSWQIEGWTGGQVTITVNTKAKTVEFKKIN